MFPGAQGLLTFHILNEITHIVENTHQKVKDCLSLFFCFFVSEFKMQRQSQKYWAYILDCSDSVDADDLTLKKATGELHQVLV